MNLVPCLLLTPQSCVRLSVCEPPDPSLRVQPFQRERLRSVLGAQQAPEIVYQPRQKQRALGPVELQERRPARNVEAVRHCR